MNNTTSNQEMSIDFNNILQQAKEFMEQAEKFDKNKLNILIIGKSGVGKSTLLNAIFGENFAKTGSGDPLTQHITDYQKGSLTIYDSKGLELKDTSAFEEIENFIETQKTKSVNEQIHLAWLCISEGGRRVEEREKELYGILKNNNIPTIIVITKAQQDKDEKGVSFQEVVKELFNTDKVMRVRALEVEDDDGFDFVEEEDTKKEDDIKEANEIKENDNNNLVNLEGDNNNDEIKKRWKRMRSNSPLFAVHF